MTRQRLLAAICTALLALGAGACAADPADEAIDDAGGQTTVDPGTDTGATGEGFDDVETDDGAGTDAGTDAEEGADAADG